ncbi:MAG: hypothetical protein AAFR74_08315 [Pseudomonadota bacterium]
MPQISHQPYIDRSLTRENLHRVLGVSRTQRSQYKDRDVEPFNTPINHDRDQRYKRQTRAGGDYNRASKTNEAFTDLDTIPLALETDQRADQPVQAAPERHRYAEPVAAPDKVPSTQPELTSTITPQVKRLIILNATTPSGATPPYARAQANIGGRGLCFGIGRFYQIDGGLGHYLKNCHDVDADAFSKAFIRSDQPNPISAETLLEALQSSDEATRMADMGGEQLWAPAWIAVFKEAAKVPVFQDMQFKTASERYLDPLIGPAQRLGLLSEKGLALLTERALLTSVEQATSLAQTVVAKGTTQQAAIAALAAAASGGSMPGLASSIAVSADLSDVAIETQAPDSEDAS